MAGTPARWVRAWRTVADALPPTANSGHTDAIGSSTAAVNSLLQRARAQLDEIGPSEDDELRPPESPEAQDLLTRYIAAFESYDVDKLAELFGGNMDYRIEKPFMGSDWIAEQAASANDAVGGTAATGSGRSPSLSGNGVRIVDANSAPKNAAKNITSEKINQPIAIVNDRFTCALVMPRMFSPMTVLNQVNRTQASKVTPASRISASTSQACGWL